MGYGREIVFVLYSHLHSDDIFKLSIVPDSDEHDRRE
jgi:hypothetical protein